MTEQKSSATLLTTLAILGRFLPHPPNFTPVGGATLFGGAKLSRPWNYLLPIGVMFVTDLFLGFHKTMPYVYISFLLIAFIGEQILRKNATLAKVAVASTAGSLLFFAITNFGVWAAGTMYAHTAAGLMQCYIMGLPFLRWTFLGDMTYSIGFFALYAYAQNTSAVRLLDTTIGSWLGETRN